MAVLIEGISVIVRRDAIDARFGGGWEAFLNFIPNGTGCYDDDLARVGFMTPRDVQAFIGELEARGLVFVGDGQAIDLAVVDQFRGATVPASWLELSTIELFEPPIRVRAAILKGSELDKIAMPPRCQYESSLSQNAHFASEGTEGDRFKFLRHEDGKDVHLDLVTGKEVYSGRPIVHGNTEAALCTQLEQICNDAQETAAAMEPLAALGDEEGVAPLVFHLREELLPQVDAMIEGPGSGVAFAHFARGMILRLLSDLRAAELSLRRSNELKSGIPGTLRELTGCLARQGRHTEALPFAQEAVETGPTCAGAWGNLAMCLRQNGRQDEAREAMEHAINLDPQDPINRYNRDNYFS
jgi:hypothetical protein